ncbi:MAG: dihydroxyacetone kinase subunit DhaL [Actinomycetota bacterium]|nr:dihydroxyacetone kinase subunit DhaL [Actinomycetota bacterium]
MTRQLTLDTTRAWVEGFADRIDTHCDQLTALDSAIGDADHGSNMTRGMTAVVAALDGSQPDIGSLLKKVGMTIVSSVGGASGPLYGTFFLRVGTAAGDRTALEPTEFAAALRAGLDGVMARGKATTGEKTMLDALVPALDALEAGLSGGRSLPDSLATAATAAAQGRDATVAMIATKGRASYLGERSVGHCDPGATSMTLLIEAAATAVSA